MLNEENQALIREIVPRTLRSLFVLRISLCMATAACAVLKILLSPPSGPFLVDLASNSPTSKEVLTGWMHGLDALVSGLLAAMIALIIATFFIQARLAGYVNRATAQEMEAL